MDNETIVTELGVAKVLKVFRSDKKAITLGARIESGKAEPDARVRVKRDGEVIGRLRLVECQTGKQTVKSVPSGTECGLRLEGKIKVEEGDVLEVYSEASKERKIVFEN